MTINEYWIGKKPILHIKDFQTSILATNYYH